MGNLETLTENYERVKAILFIRTPELGKTLLNDLKKEGKLAPDTKLLDVLEKDFYTDQEFLNLVKEGMNRIRGREECHREIVGYHASVKKYEVGDQIPLSETPDGNKAFFSDIDAIYSVCGKLGGNFVYEIRAEGKHQDVRLGWYYSLRPLTVVRRWILKEFMRTHPEARFK